MKQNAQVNIPHSRGGRGIWGRFGSTSVVCRSDLVSNLVSTSVSMSNVNLGGVESMVWGGDSGLCSGDSGLCSSDSGLKDASSSSNSSIKNNHQKLIMFVFGNCFFYLDRLK